MIGGETLIQAENLSAGYGARAVLSDISFSVRSGEKLCVVGANGSGKTTLLRVLAGTLPYKGSLAIKVRSPAATGGDTGGKIDSDMIERSRLSGRDAARETGYLAQLSTAYFPFTVAETVMLGRYAHQKRGITASPSSADRKTVAHALELCGVTGLAEERLSRLSGGQLQRVFLARAFAQDPSILLLDEPSNHLDLFYQLEILKAVEGWTGSSASGIPTSTVGTAGTSVHHAAVGVFHDLSLALRFADTVLLLDHGQVADYGEPRAVLSGNAINKAYGMNVAGAMRDLLQNW